MQTNTPEYHDLGIKKLWKLMLSETKKETLQSILNEEAFDVNDEIYVKQTWIYALRIPEKYKPRVLEIFQNSLKIQNEKTEQAINV